MANKSPKDQTDTTTKELRSMLDSPEFAKDVANMKKQGGDILGFWDHESKTPLFFIPRSAKLSDSTIEDTKTSTLVEGICFKTCQVADKDGKALNAQPGDLIAVWAKPGMKELARAEGVEVAMAYLGEKDVGKPNPMRLYDLRFSGGNPLPVSADNRKRSTQAPCIPVIVPVKGTDTSGTSGTKPSGHIPF